MPPGEPDDPESYESYMQISANVQSKIWLLKSGCCKLDSCKLLARAELLTDKLPYVNQCWTDTIEPELNYHTCRPGYV